MFYQFMLEMFKLEISSVLGKFLKMKLLNRYENGNLLEAILKTLSLRESDE